MSTVPLHRKMALGTVQFGLNYGINNPRGMVPSEEVGRILSFAHEKGIDCLDTAIAYGKSESVIGNFLKKHAASFQVVSKLPTGIKAGTVQQNIASSLDKLGLDQLYACLFHDFKDFQESTFIWDELQALKAEGSIQKIGFSLYYPDQLQWLLDEKHAFDILQIPFNVFDRRFEDFFPILLEKKVETHVRSIFLQGLFFKDWQNLPQFFEKISKKIKKINDIAKENQVSLASLLLNFVLHFDAIGKAIIGVDSLENLEENIAAWEDYHKIKSVLPQLDALRVDDENILLPFNWNLS